MNLLEKKNQSLKWLEDRFSGGAKDAEYKKLDGTVTPVEESLKRIEQGVKENKQMLEKLKLSKKGKSYVSNKKKI